MLKVTLLGQGEIGQALSKSIPETNAQITQWDRHAEKNFSQKSLADSVRDADVVILCIPTAGVRPMFMELKPLLSPLAQLVLVAKGLEHDTHLTTYEVAHSLLGDSHSLGLLYGPLIAEELLQQQYGVGVIATTSDQLAHQVQGLFQGSHIRIESCTDPTTASLLGVLKNIFALAIGIAEGLHWGNNVKGWLTAQSICEMEQIIRRLNGDSTLVTSTVGLGDFVATSFSCYSKNASVGQELATGQLTKDSEGLLALPSLKARLGNFDDLPLLQALEKISLDHLSAQSVFTELVMQ